MKEPVPGGTAEPPATGRGERQAVVLDLIGRLRWSAWARANLDAPWTRERVQDGRLGLLDRDITELHPVVAAAIANGVTSEQVEAIANGAIERAGRNPVAYVCGALRPQMVEEWLRGRQRFALVDGAVDLPDAAGSPEPLAPRPARSARKTQAAPRIAHPAHCGAAECDPKTRQRPSTTMAGSLIRCPECNGLAIAERAEDAAIEPAEADLAHRAIPLVVKQVSTH